MLCKSSETVRTGWAAIEYHIQLHKNIYRKTCCPLTESDEHQTHTHGSRAKIYRKVLVSMLYTVLRLYITGTAGLHTITYYDISSAPKWNRMSVEENPKTTPSISNVHGSDTN